MGLVYAEIELINSVDMEDARRNLIDKDEIRRIPVKALVDNGACTMAINEIIQSYLNLPFIEKRRIQLASSEAIVCDVVGPVEIRFGNRKAICSAFVLPGDSEPLLGAIPMEELDVLINVKRQELILNPDSVVGLYTMKPI
jgi:clan AA aspartic protease